MKKSMIAVRQHRGSLAASLLTVATVSTQAELDAYFGCPVTIDAASIYDDRCGWDTHLVVDAQGRCLGMADGVLA